MELLYLRLNKIQKNLTSFHNPSLLIWAADHWMSIREQIPKNVVTLLVKCYENKLSCAKNGNGKRTDNGLRRDTLMRIVYGINVIWKMKINAYCMSRHFEADYEFGEYLCVCFCVCVWIWCYVVVALNRMQTRANNTHTTKNPLCSTLIVPFCLMFATFSDFLTPIHSAQPLYYSLSAFRSESCFKCNGKMPEPSSVAQIAFLRFRIRLNGFIFFAFFLPLSVSFSFDATIKCKI